MPVVPSVLPWLVYNPRIIHRRSDHPIVVLAITTIVVSNAMIACACALQDWSPIVSFLEEVLRNVWVDRRCLPSELASHRESNDAI